MTVPRVGAGQGRRSRPGDHERAVALIDEGAARTRSLQIYSIEWITSLLSFIGRELGEDGGRARAARVGRRLHRRPRAEGPWDELPANVRAKVIARAMVANGGECEVDEDDEKIVLSFRCGSGGRLIDEGRYDVDGGPYLTLHERGGRTFDRADATRVLRALLGEQRDPAGRGGRRADVDRVPADEGGRAVRAPRLQGRVGHPRRGLRADRRRRSYQPLKSVSRRSMNACMPSAESAVALTSSCA